MINKGRGLSGRLGALLVGLGVLFLVASVTGCGSGDTASGDVTCSGAECQCPGSGDCEVDCSSACDLSCTGSGDCDFICGADCLVDCPGSGRCLVDVGDGSQVTCSGSGGCDVVCAADCTVDCPGSGECLVLCEPGASCDIARCEGVMSCGDNLQVCNGSCP